MSPPLPTAGRAAEEAFGSESDVEAILFQLEVSGCADGSTVTHGNLSLGALLARRLVAVLCDCPKGYREGAPVLAQPKGNVGREPMVQKARVFAGLMAAERKRKGANAMRLQARTHQIPLAPYSCSCFRQHGALMLTKQLALAGVRLGLSGR